jgi:deoxyribodipyrimidine photolyase-related protein
MEHFCTWLLPRFGTYQDAMHHEQRTLFHSRLSFALNVKLLSPREVIDAAISAWRSSADGINEVEGFIRQVAGWREYMRAMYWRLMPELATGELSTLDADRPLPSWYWTGDTGMACLRHVIRQSLEDAYAHHIQRLMVTGTFALVAGVDPREVDQWYYGIYIDAFDWVEKPNTLGMSQFADGGRIATKPYAASARYMQRQSSYCGLCSYDPGTRDEEDSCPFNALFWDFYARNPGLRENRRISFVYPQLDKMNETERTRLRRRAAWIRDHLNEL